MQEQGGAVRTEGSCHGPVSGQLVCYGDYLCIISVLRFKTHTVWLFKQPQRATSQPSLKVSRFKKPRRTPQGGEQGEEGGIGGPAHTEKSGTRIEWQRNKVEIPEIGAADAT